MRGRHIHLMGIGVAGAILGAGNMGFLATACLGGGP